MSLGDQTALVQDCIIVDRERIRHELSQKDGHIVLVKIRPFSKVRYIFSNPPQLPKDPWDETVEEFVKLEDLLSQRLAARYHELAASTLADLTPDEIEVVTTPPKLDDDAFQLRD